MAVRTTSTLVRGVLGDSSTHPKGQGDYDGTTDLDPFIVAASIMIDRVEACATAKEYTLSSTELEIIERWLAAHMYQMSDQGYTSKSTGGASASFMGQTGMYLEGTKYGQMALMLDTSGCLHAISKRQVATGFWLGTPPSSQTDYEDRD